MSKSNTEIRESFEKLAADIAASGDVKSVTMRELRDAVGAGRLAEGPLSLIRIHLERQGLWSTNLQLDQDLFALVYVVQSPIGRVIDAVRDVDEDSAGDLLNAVTTFAGTGSDPRDEELQELRDVLAQVRALVADVATDRVRRTS